MTDTRHVPAYCAQCRSRCGCIAVVENGRLAGIEPMPDHPTGAKLCPKGRAAPEQVYHPDRLTRPMRRTTPKGAGPTEWQPIGWDEALDEIAARMGRVRDTHGAEQVAFSVTTPSGTQLSDGIAWIERFIRAFGSPNTIYSTEICNWHKDEAAKFTTGHDIGVPDFANTDCILLWGNNPANTWLARAGEVQKGLQNGARMVVVDPRPTTFASRADCWLQVKPGTDQVLALGLAHLLVRDGRFDEAFMRDWSNGPLLLHGDEMRFLRQSDLMADGSSDVLLGQSSSGALLRYDRSTGQWLDDRADLLLDSGCRVETLSGGIDCRSAFAAYRELLDRHAPDHVSGVTGIPVEALEKAAAILGDSASVAYYTWNGVGQSSSATQTDRAMTLLHALTGSIGVPGGNVAGGIARFNDISGPELLSAEQRAKALGLAERPLGPPANAWVTGRDVYRAVLGQGPYPVRALFSFGGNLLASQPDTALARQALTALEFHVHTDFFLNATAEYADIVLPVATSWEREGLSTSFDNSLEGQRHVQLRPAVVAPVGESRSDIDIVLQLAERLGLSDRFFDGDVDRGHDHLLAPSDLTVAELRRKPEGISLEGEVTYRPHALQDESGQVAGFDTPTRRLEVWSEVLQQHVGSGLPYPAQVPEAADPLLPLSLGCAKTVAYCHSQHRNLPSLRRLVPDPLLEIGAATAAERGIADQDWVRVSTATGSFVARARVTRKLREGQVFAQHGWWVPDPSGRAYGDGTGDPLGANMNQAVSTANCDPVSGSIPLRSSACEVVRLAGDHASGVVGAV
ncbi:MULTISPECIES: molybdopterin-dependent oxidoreductase [unclassified Minwuia]|uniref:molybdopterin-containing oxidoreductase family protein n=1 Tax=unclassified Minwuia TaxID=2618799 RepID=UPI0024792C73|nr:MULTISPECIES: molybdopterin-dependent oxidoreductase [unclassified Minwuia]